MQRTESSSWQTVCVHATNNYRSLKELLILLSSTVCVCVSLQLSPVKKTNFVHVPVELPAIQPICAKRKSFLMHLLMANDRKITHRALACAPKLAHLHTALDATFVCRWFAGEARSLLGDSPSNRSLFPSKCVRWHFYGIELKQMARNKSGHCASMAGI